MHVQKFNPARPNSGQRWGMLIDLRKCIGCGACALACKQTKGTKPPVRRVIDCGLSGPPERIRNFLPLSCMNCANPPCLEACPTGATHKRPDGIVEIKADLCMGCGYCVLACPYRARTISDGSRRDALDLNVRKKTGTCTKCNFCLERVESGLGKALIPGRDPEATPVCVLACSAGALSFGNLNDPGSKISKLLKENKALRLQEELGTLPSVFYIPSAPEAKKMRAPLIAPTRQKEWKFLAALNFYLGGAGAGFYILCWIDLNRASVGAIPASFKLIGAALVILGFSGLLIKAARPARGLFILKRISSSWISREVFFGSLFVTAACYEFIHPDVFIRSVGAASAFLFALSQALILYKARGVSGWNMPVLPPLLATGAVAKGAGVMLLLYPLHLIRPGDFVLWIIFFGFASNLLFRALYLSYQEHEFRESVKSLRGLRSVLLVVGTGHILPIFLLSVLLINKGDFGSLAMTAGLSALIGAFAADTGILLKAGTYRAIRAGEPRSLYSEVGGSEETKCRIIPIESAKKKRISK